jgi:hypothetical protein
MILDTKSRGKEMLDSILYNPIKLDYLKLTRFDGYAGDGRKTPHEHRNEEQDDGKIQ